MFVIAMPKCRSPTRCRVQLLAEKYVNRKNSVKKSGAYFEDFTL